MPNVKQMKANDVQCDSDLKKRDNAVGLLQFYKYLPARFVNIPNFACEINYICV